MKHNDFMVIIHLLYAHQERFPSKKFHMSVANRTNVSPRTHINEEVVKQDSHGPLILGVGIPMTADVATLIPINLLCNWDFPKHQTKIDTTLLSWSSHAANNLTRMPVSTYKTIRKCTVDQHSSDAVWSSALRLPVECPKSLQSGQWVRSKFLNSDLQLLEACRRLGSVTLTTLNLVVGCFEVGAKMEDM